MSDDGYTEDEARAEVKRLRDIIEEYENGCHHAWKRLPTRYEYVIDEVIPADLRGDINQEAHAIRGAAWIETAIIDMGGDIDALLAACEAALNTFDVNDDYCKVCNHFLKDDGHSATCAVPVVQSAIERVKR